MCELTAARTTVDRSIPAADPLSLTAALQGVHPVSLDFVADPNQTAANVSKREEVDNPVLHPCCMEQAVLPVIRCNHTDWAETGGITKMARSETPEQMVN